MSSNKKGHSPLMLRLSRGQDIAKRILEQLDGVWCGKLKELKTELLELRACFHELGGKKNIEGCDSWDKFCTDKLHRTKRAVNMMLADEKPKPKREETSQPEDPTAEQEVPPPAPEQAADSRGPVATDKLDWAAAQSAAKKKVRQFFNPLDSVKDIEDKMNDMLDGLIPCRKFKVTVEEIVEEDSL